MEVTKLKSYFQKDYVLPTQEGVTKFLEEKTLLRHSSSMPQISTNSPLFQLKNQINHQSIIYPTPQSSRKVLQKNFEVYKIIKNVLFNERQKKFVQLISMTDEINKKISNMPKVKIVRMSSSYK